MSLSKKKTAQGDQDISTRYVDVQPHYHWGIALWALHTHIYTQYARSPRLAVLSPVHESGKSTVLNVLEALVWNYKRMSDPSVASIYRLASSHTLLIDEVDNMPITKNMRSALNDGDSRGASVTRAEKDGVKTYQIYGPVALSGIGRLPVTLMSRSVIINIYRSAKAMPKFGSGEHYFASKLHDWAKQVNLNQDPQMPTQCIGRKGDKWRSLIAIADSFDRGQKAREVALQFINEGYKPDIKEQVLRDTQKVFNLAKTNILTTDALYQKLLEDTEGEYEVDYVEEKITKRVIGNHLSDFRIRSRPHRYEGNAPQKCWFKEDFEEMWKRYK